MAVRVCASSGKKKTTRRGTNQFDKGERVSWGQTKHKESSQVTRDIGTRFWMDSWVVGVLRFALARLRVMVHIFAGRKAEVSERLALRTHRSPVVFVARTVLVDTNVRLARWLKTLAKGCPALSASLKTGIRLTHIGTRAFLDVALLQHRVGILVLGETFGVASHEAFFAEPTNGFVGRSTHHGALLP